MSRRLRVCLAVAGFPTQERPNRQVFNRVAAEGLAELVDLTVVFLRFWRPGWPLLRREGHGFGDLVTVAAPSPPIGVLGRWRWLILPAVLLSFREAGWRALRGALSNFDILHSVDATNPGVPAGYWARRAGIPHVVQAIGSDLNSVLPCHGRLPVLRGWQGRVDAIACNSEALVDVARGLAPGVAPVRAVYRGVDLGCFAPGGSAGDTVAGRSAVRFLYLGGLPSYNYLPSGRDTKGGVSLLQAWKRVEGKSEMAAASLHFAGPEGDHQMVRSWRAGLAHPERVVVSGVVLPAALPSLYRAVDVVIVPSREEGLPNVAVEASASAVAVLGSSVGGIPEVVEDGVTGRLVPPGDPVALGRAILDLARDRIRTRELGLAGRRRAEHLFDSRSFPPRMLELYHEVLERA